MNKVWTKELLFDILMMFNTIWQERHEQQVQRKQRFDEPLRLPRPCFALADAVSDPRKNTRFCVNPTRFSLFFERGRGWGKEVFLLTKVNTRADERRRAGLRRAWLFDYNMLSSSGLHGGWAVDGCWWRWGDCYMLHVTCYIKHSCNSRKGVKK